jgi:hypothetical protein
MCAGKVLTLSSLTLLLKQIQHPGEGFAGIDGVEQDSSGTIRVNGFDLQM